MLPIKDLTGKIICIYGPTAANKSSIALEIERQIPAVIINGDAMQIYSDTAILSAQPDKNIQKDVSHELYGFWQINQKYSVNKWLINATKKIKIALKNNKAAIVVGGTGLYFSSLINGLANIPEISGGVKKEVQRLIKDSNDKLSVLSRYDNKLAKKLNERDIVRITRGLEVVIETGTSVLTWQEKTISNFHQDLFYKVYVKPERETVYENIKIRFNEMLKKGVVDEVESVTNKYHIDELPKIIGLLSVYKFLHNNYTYNQMIEEVNKLTRNYAKKQYTWFNNQLKPNYVMNSLASLQRKLY